MYRDFTQEGMLYSQAVSVQDSKVAISGTVYHVGNIVNNAQQYRIAFLRLGEIQPKIFPDTEQQLAVLIVAEGAQYCAIKNSRTNCLRQLNLGRLSLTIKNFVHTQLYLWR